MSDKSDKIVVKKIPIDTYAYIHTVLEYAKFDLSYKRKLTELRTVPLTKEEEQYFVSMVNHIQKAQVLLEQLKIHNESNHTNKLKHFLRKLWPF